MTDICIPEALHAAADIIEARGLWQDDLIGCPDTTDYDAGYDPDDEDTWPIHALGAISLAAGRGQDIPYEAGTADAWFDGRIPVVQALVEYLGGDRDAEFPDQELAEWHGADGRTAEEVIAALRGCADALETARNGDEAALFDLE